MKILIAVLALFPAVVLGQQPPKAPAKSAPKKYAVDFRIVDRDYLRRVRSGDIKLPPNDPISKRERLRQAESEAVRSWIRDSDVGTEGLLPPFTIDVVQVSDKDNAIIEGGGDDHVWVAGFATKSMSDGRQTELPSATVKIGTHQYTTVIGGTKTIRSIELVELAGDTAPAKAGASAAKAK